MPSHVLNDPTHVPGMLIPIEEEPPAPRTHRPKHAAFYKPNWNARTARSVTDGFMKFQVVRLRAGVPPQAILDDIAEFCRITA